MNQVCIEKLLFIQVRYSVSSPTPYLSCAACATYIHISASQPRAPIEIEEEEEYVSEASLPAALREFTATYRDAETIT
ncbi:hypothetical protein INR49_012835, partial [Caranx melampygus]